MKVVRIVQGEGEEEWDRYALTSDRSTTYHQIGWKRIIEKTYGLDSLYLMAVNSGEVHGILPLFLINSKLFATHLASLPFLDYGGICADNIDVEKQLLAKAADLMTQLRAEYIRMHHVERHELGLATNEDKVTMILELEQEPEILWKGLKPKVRNQVRKAQKSGLEVSSGGLECLDDFYEAWAINMRDLGSPAHSRSLFENLLREFPNSAQIFVVHMGSEVVGGAVVTMFRDTLGVPWASSKREYFQHCPNNLLYWEIIKYACEQGAAYFDFGRSTRDSGTYRFKKQWGAEPRQLYFQYYLPAAGGLPEIHDDSLKYRLMTGIWKRLPLRVTKALGPRVRKSISA